MSMDRRKFLQWAGISGTALIIGCKSRNGEKGQPIIENISDAASEINVTPFIAIDKNGTVILFNPRPEMGQGTYQSIPALMAEELEIPLEKAVIRQTGGEPVFGDGQFVGGSMSVKSDYFMLRKAGASAKMMLLQAAAEQWKVPIESCYAENGHIIHQKSGKKAGYGSLVEAASKLKIPENPPLKDSKQFKILGKSAKRHDLPLKVSGKAVFGIDMEVPGMVYASIERCPVFGGELVNFDDTETRKLKGVLDIVKVERLIGRYRSTGVAVVAENYWSAVSGRKTLKIDWNYKGYDRFNSKDFATEMRKLSQNKGFKDVEKGNFQNTFNTAPVQLEAFYETPMVTHSAMEPMNCIAHWQEGNKVEIWAPTQVPGDVYKTIPKEFGLPEGSVKVNVTFIGGGFGRRLYLDYIIEAVNLSKTLGKPVKVVWKREDDMQNGPFRPMTFSQLKAGLDKSGKPLAFFHKVIAPSMQYADNKDFNLKEIDNYMTEAIGKQPYEIPNISTSYVPAPLHIPLAAWRSVTSSTLAFAEECFIDEMAVKAGKDPLLYRLEMLTKPSDVKKVLTRLRTFSNWDKPLPKGWGRGVAQLEFFAGLAGEVVEVSQQPGGGIKVEKVYVVIDLGTVVNPDNVKAQMEGAVAMALSAAVKHGITFDKGRVVQSGYHDNPIIRIDEMPSIFVDIIAEGGETIKGVGEPGIPPLAPALGNAIFNATGIRCRKLPIDLANIQGNSVG